MFLLSTVIVSTSNNTAYACDCLPPGSHDERMESYDVIFSGKVINIEKEQEMYGTASIGTLFFTFDVYKILKGDKKETMTVWVDELSSCGYFFEENKEYAVYAYKSVDHVENLSTSICSGTGPLTDAVEGFTEFGTGHSMKPEINSEFLPPLKQFKNGLHVNEIQCNDDLHLMIKHDGIPACVKTKSVEKLNERGWILVVASTLQIEKENKYTIDSFEIPYSITGANLSKIISDTEAFSLIINLENSIDDGELVITIPRELLGATHESGDDIDFFVLVDQEEIDFDEDKNSIERTLTIQFEKGAHVIEIIAPFW